RGSRLDVVSGSRQVRLQRAKDLRLVVDDKDPCRAQAGIPTADSTVGSARKKVAPRADDSAQTRPPFACANPRTIARPRPAPAWPETADPRWNGSTMESSSSG